jgi:hypothetical protein
MRGLSFVLGVVLATGAALIVALGSCSDASEGPADAERERQVTRLPTPDDPLLGEELLLALAQAKNFHHIADVHLQDANLAAATDAVRRILAVPFPANAPEGEDVILDARARLAKLLVAQGAIDEATAVVDEGIAGAARRSFFLANLHTVRGEVLEAAAALAADDDPDAARALRHRAIEAYTESNTINEALQRRLMQEVGR